MIVEAARNANTPEQQRMMLVYAAAKCEGERALWKWVTENKPNFNAATVVPAITVRISSLLHTVTTPNNSRQGQSSHQRSLEVL
jgi:hypothetical protein